MSNFITGIGSGLGAVAAGIGVGAIALGAGPVVGTQEAYKKHPALAPVGTLGGLLVGIGGCAVAVAAGTVLGGVELVKGVINTPGAITAFVRDDDLRGKDTIDLQTLDKQQLEEEQMYHAARDTVMQASEAHWFDEEGNEYSYVKVEMYTPTSDVADLTYYDALGVSPESSAGQLKKAYYMLAMKEHPDKGGETGRFQAIGAAYQVLSDPETRRKYDTMGMEGLKEVQLSDPGLVFAMLFGERKFEPYCGILTQVSALRLEEDFSLAPEEKMERLKLIQDHREKLLAKLLSERLDLWLENKEEFAVKMLKEYEELHESNLGPQMCLSIGIMYEITADAALGVRGRMTQLGFGGGPGMARGFMTTARALSAIQELDGLQAKLEVIADKERAGQIKEAELEKKLLVEEAQQKQKDLESRVAEVELEESAAGEKAKETPQHVLDETKKNLAKEIDTAEGEGDSSEKPRVESQQSEGTAQSDAPSDVPSDVAEASDAGTVAQNLTAIQKEREETWKKFQEALFNVTALDIESTVGRAAQLCLHDTSVTREIRKERAKGLLKLGRIFQAKV